MVDGVFKEENFINFNITIDHRYLDGAAGAKMQKEV